jgi:hypothetical protein
VKEEAGGKQKYSGEDAIVILGPDGQLITVWVRMETTAIALPGRRHSSA